MSYKHVKGKGIWLLALSVAALTLSACLPQEDYIEKTSDATTGSRKGAQGSYYASLLSTTSGRLQQAFAVMVNNPDFVDGSGKPLDPYGPVDMDKMVNLGHYPTADGDGELVKSAYCSGSLVSWIDSEQMSADVKTAYALALDSQVGQGGLGTVQNNKLVLKSGASINLSGKCNEKVPSGVLALAAPIALSSSVAKNAMDYQTDTAPCKDNGFDGFIGNVKRRKLTSGSSSWEVYDASECKLDTIVSDVTTATQKEGIDLSAAALGAAMNGVVDQAAKTDCGQSKVAKKVIKKDKDGNPVKDKDGNIVYETVYDTAASSCAEDIKVQAAANGYTVETRTEVERKVKDCDSVVPPVQVFSFEGIRDLKFWNKDDQGSGVQDGLSPQWTGTYGFQRTNTVLTVKNKDGQVVTTKTSYGSWAPDGVGCVRADKYRIPCKRFQEDWKDAAKLKDATLKSGDYITIQRRYLASSYSPSAGNAFNPNVQLDYDWKIVSGQCEWEINSCTWQ